MFQPTDRGMRSLRGWLSLPVLFALSIALPGLLPPCGFAGEKQRREADTPKETKSERTLFDLTYLHPKAMGVIAIRPSIIFSDPAMKPLADAANEALAQLRQEHSLSTEPKLSIEDIEEIIGFIMILPGDKKQGRDHRLRFVLTTIRVKHDFDWVNLMRQLDPKIEEVRHEDRVCYHIHCSAMIGSCSPKETMCYCVPDSRSLVFLFQKETESAFLKGQSIQRRHFCWDEDWKRVEHGLIAVAMDNRWAHGLSKEQIGGVPPWDSLTQNAVTEVAGVDWKDGIDFQAYLRGKDETACDQIVKDIKTMLAQFRRDIVDQTPPKDVSEDERQVNTFEAQWSKDLLEHARIERCESTVRVHMTAKINLAEFVKLCTKETKLQPK